MALKYAINGFGRIGRLVLRIAGASGEFELAAVNGPEDCVVSGEIDAVRAVATALALRGADLYQDT